MKDIIRTIILALLVGSSAWSQGYKPVKGSLLTSWGEKVSPDNAWRQYPRPQLKRSRWQNLNGLWEFAIAPKESSKPEGFSGNILVP
ncbi:MAG TPA: beta-galactosidase, partial [Bacteroidales bacterium]|nr:beta-galactosidase [Bacteroidales bacterium]